LYMGNPSLLKVKKGGGEGEGRTLSEKRGRKREGGDGANHLTSVSGAGILSYGYKNEEREGR